MQALHAVPVGDAVKIGDPAHRLVPGLAAPVVEVPVTVALGTQRPKESRDLADLVFLAAAAVAALVAMGATIYFCYRFAEPIIHALGEPGITVVVRLSAFILLCIGIEIIWSGGSAVLGIAR